jgi:hypothetical protein
MNNKYEVYVGNIGMVYDGSLLGEAIKIYRTYEKYSKDGYGRSAGENVVLMKNNDILVEHLGTMEETE